MKNMGLRWRSIIFSCRFLILFKMNNLAFVNFPLVCDLHQTPVGKESACPVDREENGILLPFEQSDEEMERPDENGGGALV